MGGFFYMVHWVRLLWPGGYHVRLPSRRSVVQIQHPTSAETHMWGKRLAAMLAIYTGKGVTPEMKVMG